MRAVGRAQRHREVRDRRSWRGRPACAVKPSAVAATNRRTAKGWARGPRGVSDGVVPKPILLLGDQRVAAAARSPPAARARSARSRPRAEPAVLRAARPAGALLRRADDHVVEVGEHVLAVRGIAEPPARRVRRSAGPRRAARWRAPAGRRRGRGSRPAPSPSALTTRSGCLRHGLHQADRADEAGGVELERIGDARRRRSAR